MHQSKKVLVVVAHTDDESFGCGGFIKKLSKLNYNIKAVSFTDGISSRVKNEKKILDRISSANKAAKILGFKWIKNFYYPDNSLDAIPLIKIIKIIEEIKKKFNPEILITHNFTDLNIDHRIISEACLTAFRPEPNSKLKKFITFEVPSSTDFRIIKKINNFVPNYFVDIKNTINFKLNAIKAYKSELKKYPHSRSIKGIKNLIKFRGNQVGLEHAEAFELIRYVDKK